MERSVSCKSSAVLKEELSFLLEDSTGEAEVLLVWSEVFSCFFGFLLVFLFFWVVFFFSEVSVLAEHTLPCCISKSNTHKLPVRGQF